jgi:hypothetical protein
MLPHEIRVPKSVGSGLDLRWPMEMDAHTAAAFCGFRDHRSFLASVRRGDYPAATAARGKRQLLWFRPNLEQFLQTRHGAPLDVEDHFDVAELI